MWFELTVEFKLKHYFVKHQENDLIVYASIPVDITKSFLKNSLRQSLEGTTMLWGYFKHKAICMTTMIVVGRLE